MSPGRILPRIGSARAGVCLPPQKLWRLPDVEPSFLASGIPQTFALESYEGLRSRDEQKFFDWSIGILEDAGVVGVLKNEYIYQAASLHGEIQVGAGAPYSIELSKTSVDFRQGDDINAPIQFTTGPVGSEGEDIEAHEIRSSFESVCQQAALQRAWKFCTAMTSTHSVVFRDLRLLFGGSEFGMDVETDFGEFTVTVNKWSRPGAFGYSLSNAQAQIVYSQRVADALLCDAAEAAGGVPDPARIVFAMIGAVERARRDPEWLAAAARTRIRGT